MGVVARVFRNISSPGSFAPLAVMPWQSGRPQPMEGRFASYAREGYAGNEVVYACIELRARSAAEPRMKARVGGKWVDEHRILDLLAHPNSFMDGFEFFATVLAHRDLAGNAYALKVRSASTRVVELWIMRPDRVSVVPSSEKYISHYEYDVGAGAPVQIPAADVIHWKTRNPVDQFYGQPPLMAAAGRVDVDNFMRSFVRSYFQNAGVPGGILSTKNSMKPEMREEVKRRFRNDYGGPKGWHEILVLDGTEASFSAMTTTLGGSGLVVPELEKITTRRICAVFNVPPALIGVDDANTSYASMEVIERHFWNGLSHVYKEIAAPLNDGPRRYAGQPMTGLTSEFPGVDELAFDLTDVRALREDVDKLHDRWRNDLISGGCTIEEFREATGREPKVTEGTYLLPSNLVPVPASKVADDTADIGAVRAVPVGSDGRAAGD